MASEVAAATKEFSEMKDIEERENQIVAVEDVAIKTKYAVMYGDSVFDEEPDEDQKFLEEEIAEIEKFFNATTKAIT